MKKRKKFIGIIGVSLILVSALAFQTFFSRAIAQNIIESDLLNLFQPTKLLGLSIRVIDPIDDPTKQNDVLDRLYRSVEPDIDFILTQGWARDVSNNDFYHGHLIENTFRDKDFQKGDLNCYAIIYHTKEQVNIPGQHLNRNILRDRDGYHAAHDRWTGSSFVEINAEDIRMQDQGSVYFSLTQNDSIFNVVQQNTLRKVGKYYMGLTKEMNDRVTECGLELPAPPRGKLGGGFPPGPVWRPWPGGGPGGGPFGGPGGRVRQGGAPVEEQGRLIALYIDWRIAQSRVAQAAYAPGAEVCTICHGQPETCRPTTPAEGGYGATTVVN